MMDNLAWRKFVTAASIIPSKDDRWWWWWWWRNFVEFFLNAPTISVNLEIIKIFLLSWTDVPGPPGKPTALRVDAVTIKLSWSPPQDSTDEHSSLISQIKGYYVEKKETTSSRWVRVYKKPVVETTVTVTDLSGDCEYRFRILAVNEAGIGCPSEESDIALTKPLHGKNA